MIADPNGYQLRPGGPVYRRSPGRAKIALYRGRRWVRIEMDRYPTSRPDFSPEQQDRYEDLADEYGARCFALGRRQSITRGGGRICWDVTAPIEDEDEVLARMFAIEAMDEGSALAPLSPPRASLGGGS